MDKKQNYCVGGRHEAKIIDMKVYEKILKRANLLKLKKEIVIIVVDLKFNFAK